MNALDRRTFIFGVFTGFKKNGDPAAGEDSFLKIGRVGDYPVGAERSLDSCPVFIESLPEGLRARSAEDGNRYYALRMDPAGEILLNLGAAWPSGRVLSILTGEPINL